MKKFLIHYRGDSPVCVEGFKEGCQRSCTGALHLTPKNHRTVTEDELKHIKDKYAWVSKFIRVVSEQVASSKANDDTKAKEEVIIEPAKTVDEKPATDGKKEKVWKKNK